MAVRVSVAGKVEYEVSPPDLATESTVPPELMVRPLQLQLRVEIAPPAEPDLDQ